MCHQLAYRLVCIIALGAAGSSLLAEEVNLPRAKLGFQEIASSETLVFDGKPGGVVPFLPPPDTKPILGPAHACNCDAPGFRGRVSGRVDFGDGVGYERGFAWVEALLPLRQDDGSLFFTDLRVVNFLDEDRWEYNAGLGYRWFSPVCNRVFGVNSFYDVRRTEFNNYFHQIGVGFEALSPNLEFRINGYFIVGPQVRTAGAPVLIDRGIINNNFTVQRLQATEHALGGLDTEIGGPLPVLERYIPRAYLGYYTYSSEGIDVTHGIRGRLEAQLSQRASLHFAIQHDRLFDTTVSAGITIHLGAPAYRTGNTGRASWADVLTQRVQRDVNIVITESSSSSTQSTPVPPPAKKKEESSEEL